MHTRGFVETLNKLKASVTLVLIAILISACTERQLEVGFLNKTLNGKGDFSIDNLNGGSFELDATEESVEVKVTCDRAIEKIEAENPQTHQWRDVTLLATDAKVQCATNGKAEFKLPLEHIFPYVAPTSPGDVTQDFRIRWYVKNLEGETYVYNKTLSLILFAPDLSLTAESINISKIGVLQYEVSGTCEISGGQVRIDGPFVGGAYVGDCVSGAFVVPVTINDSYSGAVANITVQHMGPGDYRVTGLESKDVIVDLVAPVVEITSPINGDKFSQATVNADGSVSVQGFCSEHLLPVQVSTGGLQVDTTCSAAGTFAANILVSHGMPSISAKQTDVAGNLGLASGVSVVVDLVGPGTFTIEGARSLTGLDSTADAFLRDKGLMVDVSLSSDMEQFHAVVKDETGTTEICDLSVAAQTLDLSACVLAQGTAYKLYVSAADSVGNQTPASNNGFSFVTEFPVPQVVRVYSTISGAQFGLSATVHLRVEYDRTLKFVGGNRPSMVLNTGVLVTASGLSADQKTLEFPYVVFSGNYAHPLGVNSTTFSGCGGCLVDLSNDVVAASMVLPADTGSQGLQVSGVKVDALPPNPVTSFTLGAVQPYFTETPVMNFTMPGDTDILSAEVKVTRQFNNTIVNNWAAITSANKLSALASVLIAGEEYALSLRLRDPIGNYSSEVTKIFTAFACPAEFIYIHNSSVAPDPFCIGQFEAKNDGSGMPRFVADHIPESLSIIDSGMRCASMGAGYDLVTNNEWRAVADLIARQADNWSSGIVGSGILHRGHTQAGSAMAATVGDPCYPNTSICSTNALRRSHTLPFNQTIWDFAGNATEAIKDTNMVAYTPAYVYPAQNTTDALNLAFGTTTVTCGAVGGPEYCGFGKIDFTNTAVSGIWRGGSVNEGNAAGVFSAKRMFDVNAVFGTSGYRCVYHP